MAFLLEYDVGNVRHYLKQEPFLTMQ